MNELVFKKIMNECSVAFATCEMLFEDNTPVDYLFLDTNQTYHDMTRSTKAQIIGRSVTSLEAYPTEETLNWINQYAKVFKEESISFIQYSHTLKKTFFVKAIKLDEKTFFTMLEPYDPYKLAFEQLKMEQESILNSIAEGIIVVSKDYDILSINRRALEMLAYDAEAGILGKPVFDFLFGVEKDIKLNRFKAIIKDIPFYNRQTRFLKSDQTWMSVSFSLHQKVINDTPIGYVISFQDIDHLKALEHELKTVEQTNSILLNHLPGMAYRCLMDESYTMTYASLGAYQLTGYTKEEIEYNQVVSFSDIIHPDYKASLYQTWVDVIKHKTEFEKEYMIITKQGENKWVYEKGKPIYNDLGEVVALEGIILDLNRRRERDLEIEHMMYHDQLTGLRNRLYFDHMLKEFEHTKQYPIGVMVADLDGTKFINDMFGRSTGDKIIKEFSSILRTFEKNGIIVARTGGDEFSLILPNSTSINTYETMIEIQNAVKLYQHQENGVNTNLSISMGFETKYDDDKPMQEIIRKAEDYMHRRKLIARSQTNRDSLSSIKATMIANSQETQEHMERMGSIALKVGEKLGLRQLVMDDLYLLAMLHDIGKIGIPSHILNKPGKLSEDEWAIMKTHPMIGYQIANSSNDLKSIAEGILAHHERFDGMGYPNGLKGRDIPLISRVVSIIDAYDAITQDRPYRKARTHEEAILELKKCTPGQFDPDIIDIFISIFE